MSDFSRFPVGTAVVFRGGAHRGKHGVVVRYGAARHLESRGLLPCVQVDGDADCHYAMAPKELKLAPKVSKKGRQKLWPVEV